MPVQPSSSPRPARREPRKSPRARRATETSETSAATTTTTPSLLEPERRRHMIAEAAYYRAQRRGFAPGFEVEDWLAAEAEIDTALTLGVARADH